MLGRIRIAFALFFAAALFGCLTAPLGAQSSSVVDLPWNRWSTHLSDDPRCAAVSDPACTWKGSGIPDDPNVTYIWRRVEVTLPEPLRTPQQLGLLIDGAQPVYEVFVNGQLIGGSGSLKARNGPNHENSVLSFPSTLASDGHLVITIHALHLYAGLPTMGYAEPRLGPFDQMRGLADVDFLAYLHYTVWLDLSELIVLAVSPVFLVFYIMDRKAREYLWLAILLGAYSVTRLVLFSRTVDIGMSFGMAVFLFAVFIPLYRIAFLEFPFALMGRRVTLPFRILEVLFLAMLMQLLVLLPVSNHAFESFSAASNMVRTLGNFAAVASNVAWIMALPFCFKSSRAEMKWIGASMAFLALIDIVNHLGFVWPALFGRNNIVVLLTTTALWGFAYLAFAVAMLIAMTFRFRRAELRNHAVEQELAAAAAVQSLLLSSASAVHSAFAVETVYLPAGEVGGDFFYIVPDKETGTEAGAHEENNRGLLIVVGDVSGKGLKAAMTVSVIVGALRTLADHRPAVVLETLNRVLCGQVTGFVTCCAAHLSPDGTVSVANAGHPAPYLNGAEIEIAPGLPLGVDAQSKWQEQTLKLGRDERLTFISDGVVESGGPHGELFGFERTQTISTQSANSIATAAKAFGAGSPQGDDITVLAVTRLHPAV